MGTGSSYITIMAGAWLTRSGTQQAIQTKEQISVPTFNQNQDGCYIALGGVQYFVPWRYIQRPRH